MTERNIGLDIARALAITLVVIGHGLPLYSNYFNTFPPFTWLGYLGVEIFFALSGFLIGQIIIKEIVFTPTWSNLGVFYIRRWFRTLPLYFLMIILLILSGKKFYPHYFVFLQNFDLDVFNFFPVTWSLAFEEWFYLLVPIIILVLKRYIKILANGKFFLIVCIGFIALFSILRLLYVIENNPTWNFGVRANIFIRLDCIMYGVLIAGLKIYFIDIYNKITKNNFICLISIVGLILFGAVYVHFMIIQNRLDTSLISRTILFSVVSIFSALFVGCISSNDFVNNITNKNSFIKIISFISITSYAVYLTHYEIYNYVQPYAINRGIIEISIIYVLWILISYVVSFILYKYFEKPVLNLRDKLTRKKKQKEFQLFKSKV